MMTVFYVLSLYRKQRLSDILLTLHAEEAKFLNFLLVIGF